jgi:hypothetical protein
VGIAHFQLSVPEYQGPASWRFSLASDTGEVSDHQVNLDTADWRYQAMLDLPGYVAANSADGANFDAADRLVEAVGDWIGEHVLGPLGPILVAHKPAVVTLRISGSADRLARLPLESARVAAKSLPMHNLTLVTEIGSPDEYPAQATDSAQDRLRILTVFQSGDDDTGLNQRGERHALEGMVKNIAATRRVAIDFRALQYDVTSGRLSDALVDSLSWDIVHVAGYAEPDLFQLPPDRQLPASRRLFPPRAPESLADLLDRICVRPKLVTISAYVSAAAIAARPLQLPGHRDPLAGADWALAGPEAAGDLAGRLGCAVATFRFPVTDDFASAYFLRLYEFLIARQLELPRAAAMTWQSLRANWSALPLTAPALYGAHAADLQLVAPPAQADPPPANVEMARLRGAPAQLFVGRHEMMRRASEVLASNSGHSGIMLYGMPGIGKTACARELAFTRNSLDPDNGFRIFLSHEITSDANGSIRIALSQFMQSLHDGIRGDFPNPSVLDDEDLLKSKLPEMTEYFRQTRVLLLLENVETALDANGRWRDRWGSVVGALTGHARGLGRVLLTSRRLPAEPLPGVVVLPVGPLGWNDTLLLARDLGSLDLLLDGEAGGTADAREKARKVLIAACGHPKLLELANAAMADTAPLDEMVAAIDRWPPVEPPLPEGGAAVDHSEQEYAALAQLLGNWTTSIAAALSAELRAFFQFLCCLSEEDRVVPVLAANWPLLAARVAQCDCGQPLNQLVAALQGHGLAAPELSVAGTLSRVQVHPVLAEHGRREVGPAIRKTVDGQLTQYWADLAASGQPGASVSLSVYRQRLEVGDDGSSAEEGT